MRSAFGEIPIERPCRMDARSVGSGVIEAFGLGRVGIEALPERRLAYRVSVVPV